MKPAGFVRLGCAIALITASIACSSKKDKDPLNDVPIGDPINVFAPTAPESDSALVSADSLSVSLDCETPTTEQRLQGPLLGATYRFVSRTVHAPDVPRSIKDESVAYTTEASGARYTKISRLTQLTYRGESALGGLPLAYQDTCSASGCDESQRKYLSGSPLYKFDVENKISTLAKREYYLPQTSCTILPDHSSRRSTSQSGIIRLDGVNYKAVKFVTRQSGTVSCLTGQIQIPRTDGKTVSMGSGEAVEIEIVLADKLPVSNVAMPLSSSTRSCERTRVYNASFINIGTKTITGTATDIANAQLVGKVLGVVEFRAAKQARIDMLKRLGDIVTIAKSEKTTADFDVTQAQLNLREAKIKSEAALVEAVRAEAIGFAAGSTEAQRKAATDLRAASNEAAAVTKSREELLTAKNELAVLANKRLAEAESALRKAELEVGR